MDETARLVHDKEVEGCHYLINTELDRQVLQYTTPWARHSA